MSDEPQRVTGKPKGEEVRGKPKGKLVRGKPKGEAVRGKPKGKLVRGKPKGEEVRGEPKGEPVRGEHKGKTVKGTKKPSKFNWRKDFDAKSLSLTLGGGYERYFKTPLSQDGNGWSTNLGIGLKNWGSIYLFYGQSSFEMTKLAYSPEPTTTDFEHSFGFAYVSPAERKIGFRTTRYFSWNNIKTTKGDYSESAMAKAKRDDIEVYIPILSGDNVDLTLLGGIIMSKTAISPDLNGMPVPGLALGGKLAVNLDIHSKKEGSETIGDIARARGSLLSWGFGSLRDLTFDEPTFEEILNKTDDTYREYLKTAGTGDDTESNGGDNGIVVMQTLAAGASVLQAGNFLDGVTPVYPWAPIVVGLAGIGKLCRNHNVSGMNDLTNVTYNLIRTYITKEKLWGDLAILTPLKFIVWGGTTLIKSDNVQLAALNYVAFNNLTSTSAKADQTPFTAGTNGRDVAISRRKHFNLSQAWDFTMGPTVVVGDHNQIMQLFGAQYTPYNRLNFSLEVGPYKDMQSKDYGLAAMAGASYEIWEDRLSVGPSGYIDHTGEANWLVNVSYSPAKD